MKAASVRHQEFGDDPILREEGDPMKWNVSQRCEFTTNTFITIDFAFWEHAVEITAKWHVLAIICYICRIVVDITNSGDGCCLELEDDGV